MNRLRYILALLAIGATAGCTTTLTVTKVDPTKRTETSGLRYSLPKPFLLVTPDPEILGGYKVEVVYLPDSGQTYGISAKSKLGSYSLNVEVGDGLLEKVEWIKSTADVAAEAARVTGEVAKAELERRLESRKEAKDEAEERAGELKALKKAVDDATLELAAADAELESWKTVRKTFEDKGEPVPFDVLKGIQQAEAKRARAELVLTQAKNALAAFEKGSDEIHNLIFNESGRKPPADQTKLRHVFGPVLYAIDDQCDPVSCSYADGKVELRVVKYMTGEAQKKFPTTAFKEQAHLISPSGTLTIDLSKENSKTVDLVFSADVFNWDPANSLLQKKTGEVLSDAISQIIQEVKPKVSNDRKIWVFTVHKSDLPQGEYALSMAFLTTAGASSGSEDSTEAVFDLKVIH